MNKLVSKLKLVGQGTVLTRVNSAKSFISHDSGSMTVLALFMMMMIFIASGFAVDVMRFDRERAKLQYALDRAVLAAADLDQDLCPKEVVRDYLSKEGLDQYLVGDPIVTPDICGSQAVTLEGYRRVEAVAQIDIEMHFMKWSGIETIASTAASVAEESIGDVEISLVLDVSGSMRGTKLTNLKKAANDFIDEMTDKSEDGKLSISIIPYSEQVSIPDNLMAQLNTEGSNQFANCIDFQAADFSNTSFNYFNVTDIATGAVVPGPSIPQTLFFTDSGTHDRRATNGFVNDQLICLSNNHNLGSGVSAGQREMTILQKDPILLKQRIDAMEANGWTSIDVGLKWGLALLDDSTRPLISTLSGAGQVPVEFADRPAPNRTADTLKVVVLMTDGANTRQHMVLPPYHDGTSSIWWSASTTTYSFVTEPNNIPNDPDFYWPSIPIYEWDSARGFYWAREVIQPVAYGANPTYRQIRCSAGNSNGCTNFITADQRDRTIDGTDGIVGPLDWPAVWERTSKDAIYDLLRSAYGRNYADNWFANSSVELNQPDKDPRVRSLCADAEQERMVIFSVAFEAPTAAKVLLQDCVTDDGAYYEATGDEIIDVFASIGSTIQNLRLTQ